MKDKRLLRGEDIWVLIMTLVAAFFFFVVPPEHTFLKIALAVVFVLDGALFCWGIHANYRVRRFWERMEELDNYYTSEQKRVTIKHLKDRGNA